MPDTLVTKMWSLFLVDIINKKYIKTDELMKVSGSKDYVKL